MKLEGQVAIITGASQGIGKAIAQLMFKQGAALVLVARTESTLREFASELLAENPDGEVTWVAIDVTVSDQVNHMVDTVLASFGKIDILINNVGRGLRKPLPETTDEDWRTLIDQNLSGTFYACRAVVPHMISRKKGLIINIASRVGRIGDADLVGYSAVKHAVVGLTRALSAEVIDHGIRVNVVCPGPVSTGRMKGLLPQLSPDEWLSPEDVAEAVLFIATSPGHTMKGKSIDLF